MIVSRGGESREYTTREGVVLHVVLTWALTDSLVGQRDGAMGPSAIHLRDSSHLHVVSALNRVQERCTSALLIVAAERHV